MAGQRKMSGPKFSVGARVHIWAREGGSSKLGIVESAPKTSRGRKYHVRYDDGTPLTYRNCPQEVDEDVLSLAKTALDWASFELLAQLRVKSAGGIDREPSG